jgi:Mannosyl-glycoprotein endo-beta-N-acetylglucosaminidase
MAENDNITGSAQYFRSTDPGNVAIEGRASNGLILDNDGNSYLVSGLNKDDLSKFQNENYQGTADVNPNNSSFIAVIKNAEHNIDLGNTNYTSFNQNLPIQSDSDKIIQPSTNESVTVSPTPTPTLPFKEPAPTPTPTVIEEETTTEFLPDREDQQDPFQLYDVQPLLGIRESGIGGAGFKVYTLSNGNLKETNNISYKIPGKSQTDRTLAFFKKFYQDTLNAIDGTYVFPEVLMAQACLESGYGDRVIDTSNFFGITKGNWKGNYILCDTKEGNNKVKVNTAIGELNYNIQIGNLWKYRRAFRAYPSIIDGFKDHTKVVSSPTYKGYDEQGTPEGQIKIIAPHYATESDYTSLILSFISILRPLFKDKYKVTKQGTKYLINKV